MKNRELKTLYSLLRPYFRRQIKALVLLLIQAICMAGLPILTVKIIDLGIGEKNITLLCKLIVIYIAIVVVYNIFMYFSNYIFNKISGEIALELRKKLIIHLHTMDGNFFTKIMSGEIISIIVNDVGNVQQLCSQTVFTTIAGFLKAIPLAIYLFILSPLLFLVICIIQPIFLVIQNKIASKIEYESINIRNSYSSYNNSLQEYMFNPMNAEKIGAGKFILNRALEKMKQNIDSTVKMYMNMTVGQINSGLKSYVLSFAIFMVGGMQIILGNTTIGVVTVFLQYSGSVLAPFTQLEQLLMKYKQTKISLNRIFSFLEKKSEITTKLQLTDGIKKGEIIIENLSFSYKEKEVFNNLTCYFKPTKITAIVGKSGVGKTTLTNLLFRFWEYKNGTIKIDGIDIRDFDLIYLRNSISIVTQDILLLNDTIYNNLVYDNRKITMQQIIDACKTADIYNFILSLEKGFDTIVGDRGIKLSGGQRQRLSIAAAILKKTPIIIFDEATSALDNLTQTHILTQIKKIFYDRTVIVIAHRLSTIADADDIIVINDGKIAEEGTHDELLEKEGIYSELYKATPIE